MDEAYVGGKPRKRNRRDDDEPGPRVPHGTKKTPVIAAAERDGRVKAKASSKFAFVGRHIHGPHTVFHSDGLDLALLGAVQP